MKLLLVALALASAGSCSTTGKTPTPAPAPPAGAYAGVPVDAMTCALVEQKDGSLGLLCDVQNRFASQLGPALGQALSACHGGPPKPGDLVVQVDCLVGDPFAGQLRKAIDLGP